MTNLKTLNEEDLSFFNQNGYLVIENMYAFSEIETARNVFDAFFENQRFNQSSFDSESIVNDIYIKSPELVDILFNAKYFDAIRDLIGKDLVFLPECAVHKNRFINWHKDTTSQERDGMSFHKNNNKPLLQCAIYFQENGEHGGGLTVIPDTQSNNDRFVITHKPTLFERVLFYFLKIVKRSIYHHIEKHETVIDVKTKVGDLLVFDLRIDHRSTFPKSNDSITKAKYAVFNTFGSPDSVIKQYQDYLKTRPEPYYRFISGHSLPDILYQKAKQHDIEIYY